MQQKIYKYVFYDVLDELIQKFRRVKPMFARERIFLGDIPNCWMENRPYLRQTMTTIIKYRYYDFIRTVKKNHILCCYKMKYDCTFNFAEYLKETRFENSF